MTAGQLTFFIERSATFDIPLEWTDENDDPVNLTGFTAEMLITTLARYGSIVLFTLSSEDMSGTITFDRPNGKIFLHIDAADTGTFDWDNAVYTLTLTSGSNVYRLLEGGVFVS